MSHFYGRLCACSIAEVSIMRSIKMFLPWCFSRNKVESQRNTCSLSAYYAVLTGNLLPTFCTRVCCLHLQVVQEDSFDYHEDGCAIAQNAVIFISRAVKTTISHRHVCVNSVCCLKYSVYRLCTSFDHSTLVILWMHNFVTMCCFVLFSNIIHVTVVFLKNENSGSGIMCEMWRLISF